MGDEIKNMRQRLLDALTDPSVTAAATAIFELGSQTPLSSLIELSRAMAVSCGATATADALSAELNGYNESTVEIPVERKVLGFASPFPVRALDLGLLEPEEIFLANREKFSQVTLTIGQPIEELIQALAQIRSGGVLALKVPAHEVTGESALTDEDTEVFIYILPREIQKIVDSARSRALSALAMRISEASLDREAKQR